MEKYKNSCRLCLGKSQGLMTDLFRCRGEEASYASQLMQLFQIEMTDYDHWPRNACRECLRLLGELCQFQTRIIASQEQLSVLSASTIVKSEFVDELIQDDPLNEVELTPIKEEVHSGPEFFTGDEQQDQDEDHTNQTERQSRSRKCKVPPKVLEKKKVRIVDKKQVAAERLAAEQLMREMKLLNCNVCQESNDTFKDLQKHMKQTHNTTNPYIFCCNLQFCRKYAHNHMKYHQDQDAFKCVDCDKRYLSQHKLDSHKIRSHVKPEDVKFACSYCDKVFANITSHRSHEMNHIPIEERPFKCDQCPFAGHSNANLLLHQRTRHTTEQEHICELCGKGYPNKYRINHHMKRAHKGHDMELVGTSTNRKSEDSELLIQETSNENDLVKKEDDQSSDSGTDVDGDDSDKDPSLYEEPRQKKSKPPSTPIVKKSVTALDKHRLDEERLVADQLMREMNLLNCNVCQESHETLKHLQKHLRIYHQVRTVHIYCCDRRFARAYAHNHMKYHQNQDAFKCPDCDKRFLTQRYLDAHRVVSHVRPEDVQFTCSHCGKGFADQWAHRLHEQTHIPSDERPFKCDQCVFSCNGNAQLVAHQKDHHTKDEEHVCELCGKVWPSKIRLDRHLSKVHTKKHTEQCDICQKYFFNLRNHKKRVHTEQEMLTCDQCPYQCTKVNMKVHVNRHHRQQEMLACDICGKMYRTKRALKEHVNGHLGIRIPCEFCSVTSTNSGNHHNHMKMKHAAEYALQKEQNRATKNTLAMVRNAQGERQEEEMIK